MPFPARSKSFIVYLASVCLALIFLAIVPNLTRSVHAQNLYQTQYPAPNFNPGVPLNQHTFVQSVIIEVISSTFCLLTGIDATNTSQGCLDIDTKTHKLGFSPPPDGDRLGGIIGLAPGMFAQLYIPPASGISHLRYMAGNFGIVQPARAQSPNGFQQLEPIQKMWIAVRNVTYLIFVVIFIIIGLGIMLRVKIDPRTVMTLQNQIPRIIIAIVLITFSYAIVGFMIDLMWTATHLGINVIVGSNTAITNPPGCAESGSASLWIRADGGTANGVNPGLLSTPFYYADNVFETPERCSGIWATSVELGNILGDILKNLVGHAIDVGLDTELDPQRTQKSCVLSNLWVFGDSSISNCLAEHAGLTPGAIIGGILGWLAKIMAIIIIMFIVIWLLFRIWLKLTQAYIMMILYAITGPLWIIMGLLPGKPLGFEKWFRRIFANLAVFPATAFLFVTAAILMNSFKTMPADNHMFVPPLIGNPNMSQFGYVLAFGVLLVAPGLLDIIRSSVHAVGKQGQMGIGSIQTSLAQGSAYPRGATRLIGKNIFGYNPYTGRAGIGARWLAGSNDKSWRYRLVQNLWGAGKDKPITRASK